MDNEEMCSIEEFFLDSCRYGDFDDVEQCLKENIDIYAIDDNQNNCIHMASANGHLGIIMRILEYAQNNQHSIYKLINHQNMDGCTPLHWAVINDQIEVVKYLIKNQAELELKNTIKLTPLQEAINLDRSKIVDLISQHISYDTEIKEEQQEDQEDDQEEQIQFKEIKDLKDEELDIIDSVEIQQHEKQDVEKPIEQNNDES
ncbi:hypothetical protein pb186bvf_002617 [Paramecium bursaria]